jgi:hypothetical protein
MAEVAAWRIGRGWTREELALRLRLVPCLPRNFREDPATLRANSMWREHCSEGDVALEPPGPPQPGGAFERLIPLVERYTFSDPRIVAGHFDPDTPLLGRPMLLELKALGLHFLCPTRVGDVRDERDAQQSLFGFRYETLEGHIECGAEWFLLRKDHATGRVSFQIRAHFHDGQFPNAWSRYGFRLLAPYYQRQWHALARQRLIAGIFGSMGVLRPPTP